MGNGTETSVARPPPKVQVLEKVVALPQKPSPLIPLRITSFKDALIFGDTLVKTGFLPRAVKTGAQAVAIILTGQELGLPPMKSLRMIDVIEGKPSLSAQLQLSIFKQAGGKAQVIESTDKSCMIHFEHPNGDKHEEIFTIEEAQRAGLAGKNKDNWNKYPKLMLRWRCFTSGLRIVAPDILGGAYAAEELASGFVDQAAAITATAQAEGPINPEEAMEATEIDAPGDGEEAVAVAPDNPEPPSQEAEPSNASSGDEQLST